MEKHINCMYPYVSGEFKPVENQTNISRVPPESGFNETGKEHKSLYALYKFSVTE